MYFVIDQELCFLIHIHIVTLCSICYRACLTPAFSSLCQLDCVTSITIDPATGIFTGSYISPVTRNATTFSGILFQDGNYGLGYFLGNAATGGFAGRGASGAVEISVIEKN
jgi:hypothetical protein